MELMLRHIPNDFRNKKEFLDKKSDNIEILVLGGSHTLYGIDPEFLKEKGFNASQVSQTLDFDLELLKKYEDRLSNLKYIILPVSYASLFEKLEKSAEPWRLKNYSIYYEIKGASHFPYYTEITSVNPAINLQRLKDFYFLGKGNAFCDSLGWDTSYSVNLESRDLVSAGQIAARIHRWEDDSYFRELVSALESIIAFAQKHNMDVILFTPPAFETYRINLDKSQLERTIEMSKAIAGSFQNCHYFNLMGDSSFNADDFYDADHLNKKGAKKLTLKMDSIIWKIGSNR